MGNFNLNLGEKTQTDPHLRLHKKIFFFCFETYPTPNETV